MVVPPVVGRVLAKVIRQGWGWMIFALSLLVLAGCSTLLSATTTPFRQVLPTFTPAAQVAVVSLATPAAGAQALPSGGNTDAENKSAQTDASDLDIAERRV